MGAGYLRENNCNARCTTGKRNADVRSLARSHTYVSLNLLRKSPRFIVVRLFIVERSSAPRPPRTRKKDLEEQRDRIPLGIKDKYRRSRNRLSAKLITSCLFDISGIVSFDRIHLFALSLFLSVSLARTTNVRSLWIDLNAVSSRS